MTGLTLIAVGIDELRDLFTGSPDAGARLRALAADAFAPPKPARGQPRSLLPQLGPLLRRPVGVPVLQPGVPTRQELEAVLHGQAVPPERLDAAWSLVRLWLADVGWSTIRVDADETAIDGLDFALAAAGVPARLSLRGLLNDRLGIPLRPASGLVTGYVRGDRATALADAWRPVLDALSPAEAALAGAIVDWLADYPTWQRDAEAEGRPRPDVVACLQLRR